MEITTHNKINNRLCGLPLETRKGYSRVGMKTDEIMAVDESGLVHGGFIFGLADHAAMIAVNHPNVVLGSSEVKFQKPVKVNDILIAEAKVTEIKNKKQSVGVAVKRGSDVVFEGSFTCFVLDKHVLE
ncbi:PaaI family thioesterase [bacterium]|nr:PaaI family thioesterase [bacterium]